MFADIATAVIALDHRRGTVFGLIHHFQIIGSIDLGNGDKTGSEGVGRKVLTQLVPDQ
ncbi:hypothetical protein [Spirosoma areae]